MKLTNLISITYQSLIVLTKTQKFTSGDCVTKALITILQYTPLFLTSVISLHKSNNTAVIPPLK